MPKAKQLIYSYCQLVIEQAPTTFFQDNPDIILLLEECGVKILCAYHEIGKVELNPHIHALVEIKYKHKTITNLIRQNIPALKGRYAIPEIKKTYQDIYNVYKYISKDGCSLIGDTWSYRDYNFVGDILGQKLEVQDNSKPARLQKLKGVIFDSTPEAKKKTGFVDTLVNELLCEYVDEAPTDEQILRDILKRFGSARKSFDEIIIKRIFNLIKYNLDEETFFENFYRKITGKRINYYEEYYDC